jgi:hypothetical protein
VAHYTEPVPGGPLIWVPDASDVAPEDDAPTVPEEALPVNIAPEESPLPEEVDDGPVEGDDSGTESITDSGGTEPAPEVS